MTALAMLSWAAAQPLTVTGTVSILPKDRDKKSRIDPSNVVIWLKPVGEAADVHRRIDTAARPKFEMRQHHKRFEPHLLAVPVGAVVSFPNLDPFFHNVFSLYDGNRFDLGLYEAGATHSASFDRAGVSFIFCNIHPEMSAVVVAVDGPYGLSNSQGHVAIVNVLPGKYAVHAWHERARGGASKPLTEAVISVDHTTLEDISLIDSGEAMAPHKNKYGLDYPPAGRGAIYK